MTDRCAHCRELEAVVLVLWDVLRDRHMQHYGYQSEPVPPALVAGLLMSRGTVVVPVDCDEFPPEHEIRRRHAA